jgi:uncharacterized membrane protein (DUF4010 family)
MGIMVLLEYISKDLLDIIITTVFSFLIGLELKTYRQQAQQKSIDFFGTTRTYTFVGILGFITYKMDTIHYSVYIAVLIIFAVLFALFYWRLLQRGGHSILTFVVLVLVYTFGPIVTMYPLWMPSLLFVLIVFILNAKQSFDKFSNNINVNEFETLGKMVLLSAVILPLLPNTNTISYLPISPFKLWLAVVVISSISYGSYLVQKYLFPTKGYFLAGILGGTYSSTATTVVLARKAKLTTPNKIIDASIIAATSMMYIRLLVIAFVFDQSTAMMLSVPFVSLFILSLLVALLYMSKGDNKADTTEYIDNNPLELGTAFLFAGLFVVMMTITTYVTKYYGDSGLHILSFVVGFTDIDPFILSLLTGKYAISQTQLISAIMIAAGSNNLLKAIYSLWFGGKEGGKHAFVWLLILGGITIAWAFY